MSNKELVFINDRDRAVTTSLSVAESFEKDHSHVLRDIRALMADLSEDFSQSNFGLAEYLDGQGKKRPCFELTRDGFTLLAMGFTGKKALEFKLKYIKAFNYMEAAIRQGYAQDSILIETQQKLIDTQQKYIAVLEKMDQYNNLQREHIEALKTINNLGQDNTTLQKKQSIRNIKRVKPALPLPPLQKPENLMRVMKPFEAVEIYNLYRKGYEIPYLAYVYGRNASSIYRAIQRGAAI